MKIDSAQIDLYGRHSLEQRHTVREPLVEGLSRTGTVQQLDLAV